MRKSQCKQCGRVAEDVGLRYVGANIGYENLCRSCVNKYREKVNA